MKHMFFALLGLLAVGIPFSSLHAGEYLAETQYPLGNGKVFEFDSQKTGRKYKIMLSLPGSYGTSGADTRYPVLYTVDGQWHFSIAGSVVGGLYYDRGARENIVVGITWEGDEANANRLRVEDFTPTHSDLFPGSGKADSYLDFLQHELIPYMARHYRTSEDRTLSGSSFGGLLTLYCLFTRPTVFTDYIASTPAIWWDEGVIDSYRASFAATELPSAVRLYVARGEMEFMQHRIDGFVDRLKTDNHPKLEIEFDVIRGAGHGGLNPEAFTRGVQFVFKKNRLQIGEAQRTAYAGSYNGAFGFSGFEVRSVDGELYAMDLKTRTESQLVAVAKNLFYLANTGTEVSFSINENGQATHMNIKVESGEFSFTRNTEGDQEDPRHTKGDTT